MSSLINFYLSPLIKVKVKRYQVLHDGSVESECRSFNLNADNACYDTLRLHLAKIFNITGEFTITYRNRQKEFETLESQKDLETALRKAYYYPHLRLTIQCQPCEVFDDWDIISPSEIPPVDLTMHSESKSSFVGNLLDQVERAMVKVSRTFSFDFSTESNCDKTPMTLTEFESFFDKEGRLIKLHEFHLAVYRSGIEPTLRPLVWMHLLNVFPEGITATERDQYLSSKGKEYHKLKLSWQRLMNEGEASDLLKDIANLVRKDVRRTDRTQKFYAGSDDNKNVQSLFNILTTYAVTHSDIHYCQGMSDMLSPILYVMHDEAMAYIAFCGLLKRLQSNFRFDGKSIKIKFRHLRKMLFFYDRELFLYLKGQDACSLLFCYRWLILELKREFPYNDALHVLEVMWGSLPPKPPENELELSKEYLPDNGSCSISSSKCNLVWKNDHYSESFKNGEQQKMHKKNNRNINESRIKEVSWKSDSHVNGKLRLPVHYRKRRYRSYISRKLSRLSLSKDDNTSARGKTKHVNICQSWTCGDNSENHSFEHNSAVVTAREFLRTQWCYSNTVNEIQLNNWLNGKWWESIGGTPEKFNDFHSVVATLRQRHGSSDSNYSTNSALSENVLMDSDCQEPSAAAKMSGQSHASKSEGYESDEAFSTEEEYNSDAEEDDKDVSDSDEDDNFQSIRLMDSFVGKKYEEAITYFQRKKDMLPPPHALGDGNPFLLFMCVTMIMEQRDIILKKRMDINELCIFFDKLVRKQKLSKVLSKARTLFGEYLNMGWNDDASDTDDEFIT